MLHRFPFTVLALSAALLSGCKSSDDSVSASIKAQANEPAVGTTVSQLTADESELEPTETIEPVLNAEDLAYRELTWDDLLPPDFDFQTIRDQIDLSSYNIQSMDDSDPDAQRLFADLQDAMSKVPMVTELNGQDTRLPGFLVPLENAGDLVSEFFLVPYYGACIHTPPPPANQIVHVVLDEGVPFDNLFEPYWAEGTLTVAKTETDIGTAGYRFEAAHIRPYE
ncbi:DUF3299 domain-containing protein [Saccharospirillum mangrovi]|uniref:DUF3299 domain-containing protein n=1 Tax=Saccharospirillum mangrovi TaxID=2161747 RepID=UPI0013003927|nr:DUF3299 domain-containing protein [Saccharospirillum mangrovi]